MRKDHRVALLVMNVGLGWGGGRVVNVGECGRVSRLDPFGGGAMPVDPSNKDSGTARSTNAETRKTPVAERRRKREVNASQFSGF